MHVDLLDPKSFEGGQPHDQFHWLREHAPVYRHAEPDGPTLNDVNKGFLDIEPETAEYFEALYDGSILYVDGVLERFFASLEELGVADDVTVH